MAKEKLITRTIKTLEVNYISADLTTNQMNEGTVTIPYTKKETEIIARVKAVIETSEIKFVTITGVTVAEEKYGMTESTFLAEATKL